MGIRGAALGRLNLNNVAVPAANILGEEEGSDTALATYSEAVALARLGWASLAVGTGQAVLDYVIPYVKQREAFGEPIARRQAVAFMCANIAIELDGLRLVTSAAPRAPSRACPSSARPRWPASSPPTRACRSAWTVCSYSAATASPRSTRWSAGTATCAPSVSPKAS